MKRAPQYATSSMNVSNGETIWLGTAVVSPTSGVVSSQTDMMMFAPLRMELAPDKVSRNDVSPVRSFVFVVGLQRRSVNDCDGQFVAALQVPRLWRAEAV